MTPLWTGFVVFVSLLLWLDLGVLNRKSHVIGVREALRWTTLWVGLALVFNVFVFFLYQNHWFGAGLGPFEPMAGHQAAIKFLTGYLVEESLSLDNVFVIALIFSYFGVPRENQHRTLFWGIVGAMLMRGVMIGAGVALLHRFEWMMYVFGSLLLITAAKMLFTHDEAVHPDRNPLVKLVRKVYPVTSHYDGHKFFTVVDGVRMMTPLFLVLVVIESTDVIFAVDSIPAIFGVTQDPFLVFSSNIFAILGLRSLYFVLAGMLHRFRYIKYSLVFVLAYIGVKMLLAEVVEIETLISLGVIALALAVGVIASLRIPAQQAGVLAEAAEQSDDDPPYPPA